MRSVLALAAVAAFASWSGSAEAFGKRNKCCGNNGGCSAYSGGYGCNGGGHRGGCSYGGGYGCAGSVVYAAPVAAAPVAAAPAPVVAHAPAAAVVVGCSGYGYGGGYGCSAYSGYNCGGGNDCCGKKRKARKCCR